MFKKEDKIFYPSNQPTSAFEAGIEKQSTCLLAD